MTSKIPANFSIIGDVVRNAPRVEGDKVIFLIKFMINDCMDGDEGEVTRSYFAVGATQKEYQDEGALTVRMKLLDRVQKELVGIIAPFSLQRLIEEFDHEIGSFDWTKLDRNELWHLEPLGTC